VTTNIKFCHIAPTPYLGLFSHYNQSHLILAHLVESDEVYRDFYTNLDDGKEKIMDNSAFEMFKQGRPMYPANKLIAMGRACKADVIVMTDHPGCPFTDTINTAQLQALVIRQAGFKTFFVPQSEIGDLHGLITSFRWAIDNPLIDLIGVSILACPHALGIDEGPLAVTSDAHKLQRYLSRWTVFKALRDAGALVNDKAYKRFHCLGMTDGPNEIDLLEDFVPYINSWDSSAAIWAGLMGVGFDCSPTGLKRGKILHHVDFNHKCHDHELLDLATKNIKFINNKLKLWEDPEHSASWERPPQ